MVRLFAGLLMWTKEIEVESLMRDISHAVL